MARRAARSQHVRLFELSRDIFGDQTTAATVTGTNLETADAQQVSNLIRQLLDTKDYLAINGGDPDTAFRRQGRGGTTMTTTTWNRKGEDWVEWAAEALGIATERPCPRCAGTGIIQAKPSQTSVIAAILGRKTAHSKETFAKTLADPRISFLKDLAVKLGTDLPSALSFVETLHADIVKATGGQ